MKCRGLLSMTFLSPLDSLPTHALLPPHLLHLQLSSSFNPPSPLPPLPLLLPLFSLPSPIPPLFLSQFPPIMSPSLPPYFLHLLLFLRFFFLFIFSQILLLILFR